MRSFKTTKLPLCGLLLVCSLMAFQNCSKGFESASSSLKYTAKDLAIEAEWRKVRGDIFRYMKEAPTPSYLYPIYDVQLATAPFLQYAIQRGNNDWLYDLMDLYSIGLQHLKTVNSFLFYYPSHFSGGTFTTSYQEELPLDRSFRLWVDTPPSGTSFTTGHESVLVSSQFLYPISVLIWEFARQEKLNDPRVHDFVNSYWDILVKDHLLRWIFNEGTSGYGVFQLRGWGCNDGDFNHAERVEHLTHRRFGTNYFQALYGTSYSAPKYCNAVWDTDLWILANVAHVLAAHQLNPAALPMDSTTFLRLRQHLDNGLKLFESRMTYKNILNFNGASVEAAIFDIGGFNGHPDYNYSADLDPTYPGYTVTGGPVNRPPMPGQNVAWDISHARRLVQFLWTMETLQDPLQLNFATDRILKGLARQMAFVIFNGDYKTPSFSNFMDGGNGWYRVNYSERPGAGYAPSAWGMGGSSFLGGGYGFWRFQEPTLEKILLAAAQNESFSYLWMKIETWPALPDSYFKNL